ncbi:MAG TPA: hypothetical protein VGJ91_15420, partial [Polyangiaceae bacterium]
FGFSVRAGVESARSITYLGPGGTTKFSWWAARLEGCPLRVRLLAPLELLPCAGVHVGRLGATGQPGSDVGASQESTRTWVDGFAGLRLELALTPWLSLQAQAELLVPITRFQFVYENPETQVYQVPPMAGGALAGVEFRFP